MSEPVVIRNAEKHDAEAVSALFTVLGHPCPSEQVRKRITVFSEAPGHRFLVAEVDGAVVGFATANTAESPRWREKTATFRLWQSRSPTSARASAGVSFER